MVTSAGTYCHYECTGCLADEPCTNTLTLPWILGEDVLNVAMTVCPETLTLNVTDDASEMVV